MAFPPPPPPLFEQRRVEVDFMRLFPPFFFFFRRRARRGDHKKRFGAVACFFPLRNPRLAREDRRAARRGPVGSPPLLFFFPRFLRLSPNKEGRNTKQSQRIVPLFLPPPLFFFFLSFNSYPPPRLIQKSHCLKVPTFSLSPFSSFLFLAADAPEENRERKGRGRGVPGFPSPLFFFSFFSSCASQQLSG